MPVLAVILVSNGPAFRVTEASPEISVLFSTHKIPLRGVLYPVQEIKLKLANCLASVSMHIVSCCVISHINCSLACVDQTNTCWATTKSDCSISNSIATSKNTTLDGSPCMSWSTYAINCGNPAYAGLQGNNCRMLQGNFQATSIPWCFLANASCSAVQNADWQYCYLNEGSCGPVAGCK